MSDELDRLLSGLAGSVAGATRTPDPAAVRKRGARRALRIRLSASALALVLTAGGATFAAMLSVHGSGGRLAPVGNTGSPTVSAPVSSPSTIASPPASASASPPVATASTSGEARTPPASASTSGSPAVAQNSPLVGIWKPTDGTSEYLIVYPDGYVGLGAEGAWQLCAGQLGQPVGASSPVRLFDTGCVAYSDAGFTVSGNSDNSILTLTTQTNAGTSYADTYARTGSGPAAVAGSGGAPAGAFAPLAGTWSDGSPGETITISAGGQVDSTRTGQGGQIGTSQGSAQLLADGSFRIIVSVATSPPTTGLWQVTVAPGGQSITVLGSYGPATFTRTSS
jgi:hypothetical protein